MFLWIIVMTVLLWQLSEDFSYGYGNVGLGGINLLCSCCWIAAAVGNCCCYRLLLLLLLLQSKYRNLLLPMHMSIQCCEYLRHTAPSQIAYIITCSRSGGAGEGGGFQSNSESALCNALVNANQPFKCKAVSLLAVYATWTNQLVPSSLTLNIISLC